MRQCRQQTCGNRVNTLNDTCIAIVGAGTLGTLVENILRLAGHTDINRYDDASDAPIRTVHEEHVIIAIGDVATRIRLYDMLTRKGHRFVTAIHPTATIAENATIGAGCIVKEHAVIEPNTIVGANSIVGNGTIVCHSTTVEPHCRLSPGVILAGHVTLERECYLGVGVTVDRTLTVGARSVIASGCTIWQPVPPDSFVRLPTQMHVEQRSE